jgi:glycosyltransferase involved in cell wall biosynthesis
MVLASAGVLDGIKQLRPLRELAGSVPPDAAVALLADVIGGFEEDPLPAYLALHALGDVRSPQADVILEDALEEDQGLAEHAAWALSRRRPIPSAVPSLVKLAEHGGFTQMMAELALESWFAETPELIWRSGRPVSDRMWLLAGPVVAFPSRRKRGDGLRIAQILMQGKVDAGLSAPGSGDGGGLVTLQVGLTSELAAHDAVSDVYLITRSVQDDSGRFVEPIESISPGGTLARIDFGPRGYVPTPDMWSLRPELERRLREFLVSEGPFDAMHLRFADVGTFAAARLGEELGIPIYFTLAPDPHAVVAAAEQAGRLMRGNYARADLQHHYLFRAWLVDWMVSSSRRLALLPRDGHRRQFRELLDIDIATSTDRFRTIAEGVDYQRSIDARRTVERLATSNDRPPALQDLGRMIDGLPDARRGLPVILSVGRLNPIKGMSRVVEAWVTDDSIRERYNLLIVGGDLTTPSKGELEVLESICEAAGLGPSEGLLLLGGRSHREVSLLMAAVSEGMPDEVGSDGIYVSGSEKEEFGLAIVEALAVGLPVIGPEVGGPATYVEHGFTGFLTDTTSAREIQRGIKWAETARRSEVRADAARRMVRTRYSLSTMAAELVDLYSPGEERRFTAS